MLLDAMRAVTSTGLRIGFHAENNAIMQHHIRQLKAAGRHDPLAHLDARPVVAELEAIQRVALFARSTATPIHIFHLSSRQGLATIDEWRAERRRRHVRNGPALLLPDIGIHADAWLAPADEPTGARARARRRAPARPGGGPHRRHRHRPLAAHPAGEVERGHLASDLGLRRRRDERALVSHIRRERRTHALAGLRARRVRGTRARVGPLPAQRRDRSWLGCRPDDRRPPA